MGRQYDKQHAATVVATAAIEKARFVGFGGAHATAAGGTSADSMGVSEHAAAIGSTVSVITGYSALVEASAPIAAHAFVKPAADGSGKAAVGSNTDHCGKAREAATAAGQMIEVVLYRHLHA